MLITFTLCYFTFEITFILFSHIRYLKMQKVKNNYIEINHLIIFIISTKIKNKITEILRDFMY